MDNTTLHTFLFHCPAALRSVVLLGSWDNFTRSYPLELDSRGGRNIWKGCFTFSDIICDGDLTQQSPKRDGPLKMGGTYWYYYKVDGDEELHNPAEESTTFCPLLPGQRLNVLDVPREGHNRSNSDTTSAFTRNPNDRYLTPVPPTPPRSHPSSRPAGTPEASTLPLPSPWTPRSATHAPMDCFLSPHNVRHARSASASPYLPSTPIFADFKALKDKLASKRANSRNRCGSKPRELEISSPVLVSGGEDLNLIPLSVYRPSVESIREAQPETTPQRSLPSLRKKFSPLASHPVDPDLDSAFGPAELSAIEERPTRRRSHVPSSIITSEFQVEQSRLRANSADTRRTRHYLFSNDPWLTSPKLMQNPQEKDTVVEDDTPSAPILSRPSSYLGAPTPDDRPTSNHGERPNPTFRKSLLDKELPALPRYLIPAPLYACNRSPTTNSEAEQSEDEFEEADDEERLDSLNLDLDLQFEQKARSHFSTWSNDSIGYNSPISDEDEIVLSPTFSSFTSNDSDGDIPQGLLIRYSYADPTPSSPTHLSCLLSQIQLQTATRTTPSSPSTSSSSSSNNDEDYEEEQDDTTSTHRISTPPRLSSLRISTFDSNLFTSPPTSPHILSTTSSRRSSRRQAACFGLGFQYSLPADETTSKSTLAESEARSVEHIMHQRTISVHRESAVSRLDALMEDFGFLGDAVI
ncbi:hypothetical protein COCMIDRAFT_92329 [Bipolaris oryzae ATCC 44560]|uniref:Uncharacterized protein n=1 Tax=Bipolaris oryzae ATCC 44560 TaxID=930090 RepID=W6ZSL1_COCMI|nr:uncharacterized protein COCMIDRAFT_92329 [Bipolaris oryzae ATCC 44560]EUC46661.1 hypothetical protein COCMIDRAFT_92329 [Bipolaris oryzae ATCC 44560]